MTTYEMDEANGLLLNLMQESFPLTERPFAEMGRQVGISEEEVLDRACALRRAHIIRQISAIFDTRALGYKSSLVAFRTPPGRLMDAVRFINQHPGVSHNYERDHVFNVWFTIAVPPEGDPEEDVAILAEQTGSTYRMLPTLVLYKIGVKLDMTGKMDPTATSADKGFRRPVEQPDTHLSPFERQFVREMQRDIDLVPEPFSRPAEALGISQQELFAMAEDFQSRKLLRRFAAILRHQKAGFRVNAMAVWVVPREEADRAGEIMAGFRSVSHCYLRPTYPDWPYSVFSMIHGRSQADCEAVAKAIQKETGIREYTLLYSVREFKKTRVEYFTEDYDRWVMKNKAVAVRAASS